MGLLMFGSRVLCNHPWPWSEGCDLGGRLGPGAPQSRVRDAE